MIFITSVLVPMAVCLPPEVPTVQCSYGRLKYPQQRIEDVNGDGIVNIQDLVQVASQLGQTGANNADVNGDGIVNIQDLVLVAAALGDVPAAPTLRHLANERLTPEIVQQWLAAAKQLAHTDATLQRGIAVLETLLAALTPEETALLAQLSESI